MKVFYLHGFASSPNSTKAAALAERFATYGIAMHTPDFNEPDFSTLTMTRMLDQLSVAMAAAGPEPAVLIGSSLGGTLGVLAAQAFGSRVSKLVLMAPAVMFAKPGHHLLPPARIDDWRRQGRTTFFHYAHNDERTLNFSFYDDSQRYDAFGAEFAQPAVIFQGRHDASVDPETVEEFARTRPNVFLTMLDDDHQLIASLPAIWTEMEEFLELDR